MIFDDGKMYQIIFSNKLKEYDLLLPTNYATSIILKYVFKQKHILSKYINQ